MSENIKDVRIKALELAVKAAPMPEDENWWPEILHCAAMFEKYIQDGANAI